MFKLNPTLDRTALAAEFARSGRLSLANFLEGDAAETLYQNLRGRNDWLEVFNNDEQLIELDRDTQASLSDQQKSDLSEGIYANARHGFQYRYETIRIPDADKERQALSDIIADFVRWLSHGDARSFLRDITGHQDIDFADGQATAYSPGHFLTGHDDDVSGKNRRAAYVMGLTPVWRTEWGGLLLFHGADNAGGQLLVPDFNRLNLFAVPQMHSVSEVTRAAAYRRYSITGWLRADG